MISIFYAKEGVSRLFVQNFLSHSTKKFRLGTLRCIRKFRVAKNFTHKKGISVNSVEKSLSHSADKVRRRILLCFERILLSKSFNQGRGNFFLSHRTKKLRQRTILCFRRFLIGKNNSWIRGGGGITIFRRSFCLTVPKYFIGEHFGVPEKFFYRTFSCIGGGHLGFCRNFLSHRTETKNFVKESFCSPEVFWYRKKFVHKRGHTTIFYRKLVVSQNRKTS